MVQLLKITPDNAGVKWGVMLRQGADLTGIVVGRETPHVTVASLEPIYTSGISAKRSLQTQH
jgi:hypothetical protein